MMKKLIFNLLYIIHLVVQDLRFVDGICSGKDGLKCCSGFKWDLHLEACIECAAGYFGINCSRSCPYPTYGYRCKQQCVCSEHQCSNTFGCSQQERTTATSTYSTRGLKSVRQKQNTDVPLYSTDWDTISVKPVMTTSGELNNNKNVCNCSVDRYNNIGYGVVEIGIFVTSVVFSILSVLTLMTKINRLFKQRKSNPESSSLPVSSGDHYLELEDLEESKYLHKSDISILLRDEKNGIKILFNKENDAYFLELPSKYFEKDSRNAANVIRNKQIESSLTSMESSCHSVREDGYVSPKPCHKTLGRERSDSCDKTACAHCGCFQDLRSTGDAYLTVTRETMGSIA